MLCFHEFKKAEALPIRDYLDYYGFRVRIFRCKCKKCGKIKNKKFY